MRRPRATGCASSWLAWPTATSRCSTGSRTGDPVRRSPFPPNCCRRGVVHRDLKPENLLLADDANGRAPRPEIADFGLSALAGACVACRPSSLPLSHRPAAPPLLHAVAGEASAIAAATPAPVVPLTPALTPAQHTPATPRRRHPRCGHPEHRAPHVVALAEPLRRPCPRCRCRPSPRRRPCAGTRCSSSSIAQGPPQRWHPCRGGHTALAQHQSQPEGPLPSLCPPLLRCEPVLSPGWHCCSSPLTLCLLKSPGTPRSLPSSVDGFAGPHSQVRRRHRHSAEPQPCSPRRLLHPCRVLLPLQRRCRLRRPSSCRPCARQPPPPLPLPPRWTRRPAAVRAPLTLRPWVRATAASARSGLQAALVPGTASGLPVATRPPVRPRLRAPLPLRLQQPALPAQLPLRTPPPPHPAHGSVALHRLRSVGGLAALLRAGDHSRGQQRQPRRVRRHPLHARTRQPRGAQAGAAGAAAGSSDGPKAGSVAGPWGVILHAMLAGSLPFAEDLGACSRCAAQCPR